LYLKLQWPSILQEITGGEQKQQTFSRHAQTGTPIIERRVKRSSANRLKREVISLKVENQNLRQELLELQWQMQQQKMKILAALGEYIGESEVPEGFF